jgi:hypothetical protein
MDIETFGRPFRIAGHVEKRDAETGELISIDADETQWFEADGSLVTDAARIAELEAGVSAGRETENC